MRAGAQACKGLPARPEHGVYPPSFRGGRDLLWGALPRDQQRHAPLVPLPHQGGRRSAPMQCTNTMHHTMHTHNAPIQRTNAIHHATLHATPPLLTKATNAYIQHLFSAPELQPAAQQSRSGGAFSSVGQRFAADLTELLATLRRTELHFIRCATPSSLQPHAHHTPTSPPHARGPARPARYEA